MEKDSNLSIVNERSHQIQTVHKIGSAIFIFGLFFLVNSIFIKILLTKQQSIIIGVLLLFIGSIIFTFNSVKQFSLGSHYSNSISVWQKAGLIFGSFGLIYFCLSWSGIDILHPTYGFLITFSSFVIGVFLYTYGAYVQNLNRGKNTMNMFNSLTNRGLIAWLLGVFLTAFYIAIFYYPETLTLLIKQFDFISYFLRGKSADRWFMYGSIYTFAILFLGVKFIVKYRDNRYHFIRTCIVIFSQLVFAYFIPQILEGLSYNSVTDESGNFLGYFSANPVDSWPLNYSFFDPYTIKAYAQPAYQPVGIAYLVWGIFFFLILTPIITYFVGKRWYCSFLCGCGGLAETAGDSFRHLSDKSIKAWKIERWLIHSVTLFILIMTLAVLYSYLSGKDFTIGYYTLDKQIFYYSSSFLLLLTAFGLYILNMSLKKNNNYLIAGIVILILLIIFLSIGYFSGTKEAFLLKSSSIKKSYGFFIGTLFSGIIGVGFYPILGNRIWCRFGCPMAAYMGIIQRFKSRFRITTNGGQCISCGNCSTYCEQGIDVRAYAEKGQNIVRASCVGCGICADVCPRGVLKLENGPEEKRINSGPISYENGKFKLKQ